MDTSLIKYFNDLGYTIEVDSNRTEKWYDILMDNKLVCQIDTDVPLDAIVQDLECLYLNKETTSDVDYTISGPDSPHLTEMCKRVYEYNNKHMLPNGQFLFRL